jgi:uncharacterized membrane protein
MSDAVDVRLQAEADPEISTRFHIRFVWLVTTLAGSVIWLRPIGSSFWLDELVTWWVVKDGLGDTIHRSLAYQSQSPFYFSIAWLTRHVSSTELVMRLPSLVASVLAAFVLYRLALRWGDAEFGRLAVFAFATWSGIDFAASEARPYAIGILCVVASTFLLERWLDSGRARSAIAYAVVAWLVIMAQYLFGLVLLAHVTYVMARLHDRSTRVRAVVIAATFGGIAVATLPLIGQLLSVWRNRALLSVPWGGTVSGLMALLIPGGVAAALLLGGGLAAANGRVEIRPLPLARRVLLLLFGWLLFPTMALFAVSALTPIHVASGRYAISAAPAGALLLAWIVRSVNPSVARRIVLVMLAIVAVVTETHILKEDEDWRGAISVTRPLTDQTTLVLLHPALIESAHLELFEDPVWRSYLLAPISYYPLSGRVALLPYVLDPAAETYVEGILERDLAGVDRIILVTRYAWVGYQAWLEGRLASDGWSSISLGSYGRISVVEFTRQ